MTRAPDSVLTILLVEDDDVAAESVVKSLRRAGCAFPVAWAHGRDPLRSAPRPRVILLDLNMPRMSGFEFLQHMRADPALHDEVVFVLTTSDADNDRARAYEENIAGYMVKSLVGPQFSRLAHLLSSYHAAVRLP